MKIQYLIFLFLLIFFWLPASEAQQVQQRLPWDLWLNPETTDFETIRQNVEDWFEGKDQGRGTGYKQWKRWEFMMESRLTPEGQITNFAARNLRAQRAYQPDLPEEQLRTHGGFWNQLAPTDGYILGNSGYNPGLGRVNVIAFHPTDQMTVYAGTPAGGLWRTTNEGTSWTCLTDGLPRIGVSGIVVHPDNPNIIYILTGDGDGGDTWSVGVMRSTDGGVNWFTRGLTFDPATMVRPYKLAMKPGDPATLFAVTNQGIYRTEDNGLSWDLVRAGSFRDLEFKPGEPETVFACTANSFWRSENGGDSGTWSTSNSGLPAGENRAAIAVSADEPTWIYYLCGPGGPSGQFNGLYRSTNSGDSWSLRSNTPNILDGSVNGTASCTNGCDQANYDLAIAIDPNEGTEVITGGINVWRDESNGGTSMSIISHWNWNTAQSNNLEYTHADIHELVYQDNNRLWCGSDGGVFLSTNDGINWTDLTSAGTNNGLTATQFYRIAGTPQNSNIMIGGTQDNGSNRWTGGNDITHFDGADGMDCIIDFTNSSVQYHCRQRGNLFKSSNSGSTISNINPSNSDGAWVTPIAMDPQNNTEIWAGYVDTIYRSTNGGSSWSSLIPAFTNESFRNIWCAPSNSQVIYAASNNFIYRSGNNGAGWADKSSGLPLGTTNITGITTDVHNSNDVWVSLSGYVDGEKVYYSNDGGDSWTNVSGSLPNVPVNCIEYDSVETNDNAVYIGTDIGVFYRDNSLSDWLPFRNGLPNVPIFDLEVHGNGANKLRAGTHGRGIWESNLYSNCPTGWNLSDVNLPGNSPQGFKFYQASNTITSTRHYHGGTGTEVYYKAGNYVQLNEGFRAHALDVFRAWNGPCGSGIPDAPLAMDPTQVDDQEVMTTDEGTVLTPAIRDVRVTGKKLSIASRGEQKVHVGIVNDSGKQIERVLTDHTINGSEVIDLTYVDLPEGRYRVVVYGEHVGKAEALFVVRR